MKRYSLPNTLTYLGIIPFVALAASRHLDVLHKYDVLQVRMLLIYSGMIIAFLAGIDWGIVISQPRAQLFILISTNILVVITAILLSFLNIKLIILSFLYQLAQDLYLAKVKLYPRDLLKSRSIATLFAIVSIMVF